MGTDIRVEQMIHDIVSKDDFKDWIMEQHGKLIND